MMAGGREYADKKRPRWVQNERKSNTQIVCAVTVLPRMELLTQTLKRSTRQCSQCVRNAQMQKNNLLFRDPMENNATRKTV